MVAAPEVAVQGVAPKHRSAPPQQAGPPAVHGESVGVGCIVLQMYSSFNACDADRTAACFTEDVVYEDLLLGNSTLVESRADFRELIQTHPVFVAERFCGVLGMPPLDIAVCVDGLSEDVARHSVGVEWHVEVGGQPLAMGRGLSYMRICPRTGLIRRAVDIAEAPWRVIGLIVAPFARGIRGLSRFVAGLLLPPLVVSSSGALTFLFLGLIFMDRSSMHELRADVDQLDEFRATIDMGSGAGLLDALKSLSGLYPWEH